MRLLALLLILLATGALARADTVFKVGVATREYVPVEPYDWRGAKTHALSAMIWYPAAAEAREEALWVGPPIFPFYSAGRAARDAPQAAGPPRPLIVLSHGFGGAASDLAWLGTALAAHGMIAIAINHPGNDASEAWTVDGYALMWLRAADLSATIDAVLHDKAFGSQIDPARIGAVGHSLGGYTILAVAGGITDPARIQAFCQSSAADALCTPPEAVLELRRKSLALLDSDPEFRQRYAKARHSYRDARIRAVFAMAPGLVPIFTPESLGNVSIPVAIVSGAADEITPLASGAEALAKAIPNATLKLFPHAGHFVFFDTCTTMGRLFIRAACRDPDGTDRVAIHAETIGLALEFFAANLR
jgi:predicted dienelactone hydrolase